MRGFKKPALVPGHPDLYDHQPDADTMADALTKWAQEWDTDWIIVDTHPGASPAAHGALAVANIVLAPTALRTAELDATPRRSWSTKSPTIRVSRSRCQLEVAPA
jgi:chromosome partitioning protein